jgi:uncharacterized protein YndB with AHSA1/START domain
MDPLSYRLDRSVAIQATPETVFGFFTDSARWAKWWGAGSTIDAKPGGKLLIRHPGGVETVGEVIEVLPPERIVFTYGYASGKPIPPGGSRVTIRLEPDGQGTRLHLLHELADAAARDLHVQGWRFQLSLFANLVADEVYAGAGEVVDAWFDAWALTDDRMRQDAFTRIAAADVRFRDRFSLLDGLADLTAHAGAAQRFMPGVRLERRGEIRHSHGMVLADWFAAARDGQERMSGTSLFVMAPDGRINSVTGFANPPARP